MKLGWTPLILSALVVTPAISSQVNSPAPAASQIATVRLQGAIVNTAEGKQASNEWQVQFAPGSAELHNMQRQIEELQSKLNANPAVLNDQERNRLPLEGERLTRSFQRKQQYFQEDLNAAQQDIIGNMAPKMIDVLSKYAKQKG